MNEGKELIKALDDIEKEKASAKIFCLKLLRILLSLPARMSTAKQITSV